MGLFDKLTGTRRPAGDVAPRSATEVHDALLGLNRPDVPYLVRDGREEGADLVAEWRITDPAWRTFFARTEVNRVCQVRMRLVPHKCEVRSLDRHYEVTWARDVATLSLTAEVRRGRARTVSKRWTPGRADGGGVEATETFGFDTAELTDPLRRTVLDAGWTWRGVVAGRW